MKAFSAMRSVLLVSVCALGVAACTTTPVKTTSPQQELSFTNITPYHVNAARVEVETRYAPGADPKAVASTFPVSPDVAVRRYAENRLQPGGQTGGLKFIIDDARVYQQQIKPDNKVVNWMGAGNQDQYEIFLKVALYYTDEMGMQSGRKGEFPFCRFMIHNLADVQNFCILSTSFKIVFGGSSFCCFRPPPAALTLPRFPPLSEKYRGNSA